MSCRVRSWAAWFGCAASARSRSRSRSAVRDVDDVARGAEHHALAARIGAAALADDAGDGADVAAISGTTVSGSCWFTRICVDRFPGDLGRIGLEQLARTSSVESDEEAPWLPTSLCWLQSTVSSKAAWSHSPVRMRIASATGITKILPSPGCRCG